MPPNTQPDTQKLSRSPDFDDKDSFEEDEVIDKNWNCFEHILWFNVFWFTGLHIAATYGAYLFFTDSKILTILFGKISFL